MNRSSLSSTEMLHLLGQRLLLHKGQDHSRRKASRVTANTRSYPSASFSVEKNHVRRDNQLVLPRAEIIGGRIVGMLVPQLRPDETRVLAPDIEPMPPPDAMGAVSGLRSRAL